MALVPFPGSHSGALKLPPPDDQESDVDRMSFLDHLDELRRRIIYACLGIMAGVVVSFAFIDRIYTFLMAPTVATLPPESRLIYTQPGEAFSLYIYIALISGATVAAPFIMDQVWGFIAPGLYSTEKRFAVPFVLFSTIGFLAGAAFNHYVAFPFVMIFFASFNTPDLTFMPKLADVFGLYAKMLLGLGVVFQMPAVMFFLAKMHIVTARFLIAKFKYAMLMFIVAAAVITPTGDPVNLMIFTAPMIALYGISIVIAWAVGPIRRRALGRIDNSSADFH
jgi:sec-independent protein translocase protein TatC